MSAEPTWRDVAILYPSVVQKYVQERGPLPDGPVTSEAWESFCSWAASDAEATP